MNVYEYFNIPLMSLRWIVIGKLNSITLFLAEQAVATIIVFRESAYYTPNNDWRTRTRKENLL